jgi:hypothetical protein
MRLVAMRLVAMRLVAMRLMTWRLVTVRLVMLGLVRLLVMAFEEQGFLVVIGSGVDDILTVSCVTRGDGENRSA